MPSGRMHLALRAVRKVADDAQDSSQQTLNLGRHLSGQSPGGHFPTYPYPKTTICLNGMGTDLSSQLSRSGKARSLTQNQAFHGKAQCTSQLTHSILAWSNRSHLIPVGTASIILDIHLMIHSKTFRRSISAPPLHFFTFGPRDLHSFQCIDGSRFDAAGLSTAPR